MEQFIEEIRQELESIISDTEKVVIKKENQTLYSVDIIDKTNKVAFINSLKSR